MKKSKDKLEHVGTNWKLPMHIGTASVSHYVQPLLLEDLKKQPVFLPWASFAAGQEPGETGGGDPVGGAVGLAAVSWQS